MVTQPSGYREIEHTADWELKVWAPDLAGLLEQAARGMYSMMGARLQHEQHQIRVVELKAADQEGLLVVFLSELLYFIEQENIGFEKFDIQLNGLWLNAHLTGAHLAPIDKEIKAVTYHKLAVLKTEQGFVVNVVFDV
jgi:SHS2 domain-containing protein